jgi:hypothetical protein
MKPPAMARTSLGSKARSNGWEMAVALSKMFRMVLWRDSMVTMVAAAVRTRGSWTRCAAPRYAPTPTCSTTRATVTMVDTSVRADEKSNLQPVGGLAPNEVMMAWVGPKNCQKDGEGRITNAYLESGDMGTLVDLDGCNLLDGEIRG